MHNHLLSIIVPIYNVEDYLTECLDSLNNQDKADVEILLVDDGSTDGSSKKAKAFCKENPRHFKYFYKDNGGLSDARNFGVENATGEYLAFIDSDDYVAPDSFERIKKKLLSKVDILCFAMAEVSEKGDYIRHIPANSVLSPNEYNVVDSSFIFSKSLPNACNKVFKAHLFKDHQIEFPKGLWYEDLATVPRLLVKADSVSIIDDELYFYRTRDGAITKTFTLKVMDIYPVLEQLKNNLSLENKVDLTADVNTWYINLTVITLARFSAIEPSEDKDLALIEIARFIKLQFTDTTDIFSNSYSVLRYKVFVLLIRLGFIKLVAKTIDKLVKLKKIKI